MLKLKKNLKFYLKNNRKKLLRIRKNLFKNKNSILNLSLNKLKFTYTRFFLYIKLTQNNLFCTLINPYKGKTILNSSSGIEKLKISKKMLKYNSKLILTNFLEKILKIIKNYSLFVNIICPKYLKRRILFQVKKTLNINNIILNVLNNKPFNGFKKKKKKRNKQRGLRIFK